MHRFNARLSRTDGLALALLLVYVLVFSTLTIRQHNAFQTNALDLAKFDQSIWSTAQGQPYRITIGEDLVIQSHFSPALALFAPFYWLWPDVRLLFVLQSLLLGGAGFLIYWSFRREQPWLGLAVFAAYLMHPTLHQVNLVEFRRLTLAVFATSFAFYHLRRRQYGWMSLGLALALLSKEDMSLVVIAFGLYILLVHRQRWVGLTAFAIGLAWAILVPFSLLPALMPHDPFEGYQHAGANYAYLGTGLGEMAGSILADPAVLVTYAGDSRRWLAVLSFLWPTGFVFLLAPELALFLLPHLAYLLLSSDDAMGRLQAWYPSVMLILLYWAAAVGLPRLPRNWRGWTAAGLVVLSLAAWISSSELWPGPAFAAERYRVTEHHRAVAEVLAEIPAEAIVMAQDPLVPHLAHREEIYLFPWVRGGNQPEYLVFDREMRTYPFLPDEYRSRFYDVLAGTEYELAEQVGSLYVFRHGSEAAPAAVLDETWADAFHLGGYSVAATGEEGQFVKKWIELPAGGTLRVELFWEAAAAMDANYTVFVHAVAPDGRLLAQHDSWPADAHRPTSALQPGERVRDVHYLTLPEAVSAEALTLRIGIYETAGAETIPTAAGEPFILLPVKT